MQGDQRRAGSRCRESPPVARVGGRRAGAGVRARSGRLRCRRPRSRAPPAMIAVPSEHRRRLRLTPAWTADAATSASGVVGEAVFALQRPLHAYFPRARAADRDAAAVPDSRCRACHEEVLDGVVVSNGIRINHASCATTASCTDCHSSTAHGSATRWVRSYDMDGCLECHMDVGQRGMRPLSPGQERLRSRQVLRLRRDSRSQMEDHARDGRRRHLHRVPRGARLRRLPRRGRAARTEVRRRPRVVCGSTEGEVRVLPQGGVLQRLPRDEDAAPGRIHSAACRSARRSSLTCARAAMTKSDCTNCHVKHAHPGGAVGTLFAGEVGSGERRACEPPPGRCDPHADPDHPHLEPEGGLPALRDDRPVPDTHLGHRPHVRHDGPG